YIKLENLVKRTAFIEYMKKHEILTVFHYIPLHTAPAGQQFGRFHGEDVYTTKESDRLVRLPMYYGLTVEQVDEICDRVEEYLCKSF
ncbi:MAG: DegT/DnrJ/EryC1/StrS family aminotransferase, partial [Acetatifactor sp.]|nr:DegT/DnrJ/EryC1/StrS family aminotransferase [Acetatifactor sp.]